MGTIKTTNIETITGSGTLTLGQSGETISVPSGATLDLSNATQTGVGGTMTPAFQAYLSSNQTISNGTWTKVQFNTEIYDTDSDYDNSTNYRFTPTTAGKYFCYYSIKSSWTGATGGHDVRSKFQKNGGDITGYTDADLHDFGNGANIEFIATISQSAVINFNGSSDYLEVYNRSEAPTPFVAGASYFGAYKIIE